MQDLLHLAVLSVLKRVALREVEQRASGDPLQQRPAMLQGLVLVVD